MTRAKGVAVDQDGSAYFVTDSNSGAGDMIGVAKVQPNGSFDPSFAGTGRETLFGFGTNVAPYAVALQRDGKILVAGYATVGSNTWFAIARLLPDGSLDPTFSGDGRMLTPARERQFGSAGTRDRLTGEDRRCWRIARRLDSPEHRGTASDARRLT